MKNKQKIPRRSTLPYLLILLVAGMPLLARGQNAPPASQVFLAQIGAENGHLKISSVTPISPSAGYNNQPSFFSDGKSLFYTSIREDKQADIYRYTIADKSTTKVTNTPESEYSPTLTPDGKSISVIRVEADKTQRLWRFPLDGGAPSLILDQIKPVGYHVWVDAKTLMLFILGSPNTLQLVDVPTQKATVIAENIGRTLLRVPGQGKVSFVQKGSDNESIIKAYDIKTRQVTVLTKALAGGDYFAWLPSGVLLMAKDSKLYEWDAKKDTDWREAADLAGFGVKGITRMAVSPSGDRLALVGVPAGQQ